VLLLALSNPSFMKKLFTFLMACICLTASAQTIDKNFPEVGGDVYALAHDKDRNVLFIGGNFEWVGPHTPNAAMLDAVTAKPDLSFPEVDGEIKTAVPDGNGGWYIGGSFTKVDGIDRRCLAHLNSNYALTAWNPSPDNIVTKMIHTGNVVYIAGMFTQMGGQPRAYIAQVDASGTGMVTGWNPSPNAPITSMDLGANALYIAGNFNAVNGTMRDNLAAVDRTTGLLLPFAAGYTINGSVNDILVSGNELYVGGGFTQINSVNRNYLAAIDVNTGNLTSFYHTPNAAVNHLGLSGNRIYATGYFTTVNSTPRRGIAAFDATTGLLSSWMVNATSLNFSSIAFDDAGTTMYFTGNVYLPSVYRAGAGALNLSTGTLLPWEPQPAGGLANFVVSSGNQVLLGGVFRSAGSTRIVSGLAAIDLNTGLPISFPGINQGKEVRSLLLDGDMLYVGGNFEYLDTKKRNDLAAVNISIDEVADFDPNVDGLGVRTMALHNGVLYIGGYITDIGFQPRKFLGSLDAVTGAPTSWDPSCSNMVTALAVDGNTLYVGGKFTSIQGYGRDKLAAIDLGTGMPTSWYEAGTIDEDVLRIAVNNKGVYVAGNFDFVNGELHKLLVQLNKTDGKPTAWDAKLTGDEIVGLMATDDYLYIGGHFGTPVYAEGYRMSYINAQNAASYNWDVTYDYPGASGVQAMLLHNGRLYTGGMFSKIQDVFRMGMTSFDWQLPQSIEAQTIKVNELSVYPNPVQNGKFYCSFTSNQQQTLVLNVTDITGKQVHTQTIAAKAGMNSIAVDVKGVTQLLFVHLQGYGTQKILVGKM
jgi:trimeric autotransporter adhesin